MIGTRTSNIIGFLNKLRLSVTRYKLLLALPQAEFSKQIVKTIVKHIGADPEISFVDFPCGNGSISLRLAKYFPKSKFNCFDLDLDELNKLRQVNSLKNIKVERRDIFEPLDLKANCWLIINSLFLLEDLSLVVNNIAPTKHVIVIYPNIKTNRYKKLIKQKPNLNLHSLNTLEVENLFKAKGYKVVETSGINFVSDNISKTAWKLLKYIPITERLMIIKGSPNYYLSLFSKLESPRVN